MTTPTETALIVESFPWAGSGLAREYANRGWNVIGTVRANGPADCPPCSSRPSMATGFGSRWWTSTSRNRLLHCGSALPGNGSPCCS